MQQKETNPQLPGYAISYASCLVYIAFLHVMHQKESYPQLPRVCYVSCLLSGVYSFSVRHAAEQNKPTIRSDILCLFSGSYTVSARHASEGNKSTTYSGMLNLASDVYGYSACLAFEYSHTQCRNARDL